jgi:hypothetical protein
MNKNSSIIHGILSKNVYDSVLNIIPDLVLKHSLIIHRSGSLARVFRVPFRTQPPPTSVPCKVSMENDKTRQ